MTWALKNPKRFLYEQAEIEQLAASAPWIKAVSWRIEKGLQIEVDIDLEVHGRIYAGKLAYPDFFPNTPAYIRPRNESERWSVHQYGEGGSLCLEWRADNWNPDVTGADLIRSTYRLLETEKNPETPARVPSAHSITWGQEMRDKTRRLVATRAVFEALRAIPTGTAVKVVTKTLLHNFGSVSFVTTIGKADDAFADIADIPKGMHTCFPLFAWEGGGFAIRSDLFEESAPIRSVGDLTKLIESAGLSAQVTLDRDPGSTKFYDTLVLLISAAVPESLRAFGVNGEDLRTYVVIPPDNVTSARLPVEYECLESIRVGIIGMGSLGSKVAISLARSGLRRFLLIDDDVLTLGNISRHELDWSAVGVNKVEAVQEALDLIAPEMDIIVRAHRLAGQESAMAAAAALKELGSCDLIIDATANPSVFVLAATVARENRRPMCWGEVFAGGIGGLIARARPDMDSNPVAVRNAILKHYESLPDAPYKTASGYDIVGEEKPIVADDADVTQISSALTRLALDTALRRDPSGFPHPVYLIGLRSEWIFQQPFDTQPIAVEGVGWDEVGEIATDADREAALQAILSILMGN